MEMINLLPREQRRQLQAARTNVLLLRYTLGMAIAAAALLLVALVAYLLLADMFKTAENEIASNQSQVGRFSQVQAQATDYRKSLSDARSLFSSEIEYSKVYLAIARVIPEGTALDKLDLSPSTIGTPLAIPVKIKGQAEASSLIAAFQGAAIFNNTATFGALSINTGDDSATYPYVIIINATINKEAVE